MTDLQTHHLETGDGPFKVLKIIAEQPVRQVLFAAGRGGHPKRHLQLMESLADNGSTVIAPCFEMIRPSFPSNADLASRIAWSEHALDKLAVPDLPLMGIGHSIGGVILLTLAGAVATPMAGSPVTCNTQRIFDRLVLMTPPTAFFRRPGALDNIRTPMLVWMGAEDHVLPLEHGYFLQQTLEGYADVDVRVEEGAGHFTFMDELPPNVTDCHPNRDIFMTTLHKKICEYASLT